MRGHDVERAAGPGGIGTREEAVVVVHEAAEDDERVPVARLDRGVGGAQEAHVLPGGAAPEASVVRLVPDLPGADATPEVARGPAREAGEVGAATRRGRLPAAAVGPGRRPEQRSQDLHAARASQIHAAVGESARASR